MNETFADYRQLMRSFAPQVIAILVAVMRDKDAPELTRLRAAKMILDLAWGRPRAERVTCELR
jgi:hypothetical protein